MSIGTKIFICLVLLADILFVTFTAKAYFAQDAEIFPRRVNQVEQAPDASQSPFDKIILPVAPDASLSGILFPAQASPSLLIAFGGNAHDVVGFATFLKNDVFKKENVAVTGFSYRGYPNVLGTPSTGTPTEENTYADAERVYDTFTHRLKPAKVYAIGYSLGTAVATHLATTRRLDGIILVAPPASIRRLGQEKYPYLPVGLLVKYPFATEDMLPKVVSPVLILHSRTDGLIPPTHADILHAAQPSAQLIELEGTDHGNILHHSRLPQLLRTFVGQPLQD